MTEFLEQLVNEIRDLKLRVIALEQSVVAVPADQPQEREAQPAEEVHEAEDLAVWSEAESAPPWDKRESFPVWEESPDVNQVEDVPELAADETLMEETAVIAEGAQDSEETIQTWLKRFAAGPWFKIIGILVLLIGIACILKLFLR